MGRASRDKGQRGERQVRDLLRRCGFKAERDGSEFGDLKHNVPATRIEVKLCERWSIPEWLRQVEADAEPHETPVLVFRKSRGPWRVVVDAEHYFTLRANERTSLRKAA
jgi:hypothetical protein